jgi:Flp pilus assembly protein TadG
VIRSKLNQPKLKQPRRGGRQRGAAALEFGLLFLIFFAVLYGIIGYSLVMLLQQGLTHAAAEGTRAAVRLDPMRFATVTAYQSAAEALARDAALNALNWLPEPSRSKVRSKVQGPGGFVASWATGNRSV